MSPEILGVVMILVMLGAIFVGFPISFTLIFLGMVFGYDGFGDLVFYLMTFQFYSVMMEQTLAAVPLFVFMGIMMEQAGLMERLFEAVQKMLARVRGSLYLAVLFVSTIFAAATGIVGASVTILGIMAAKTMNRSGYNVRLAAGTITAGGTLGILIPPSIMLVVMGPVLEVPVTDLFAAAMIPGIMLAVMYALYALVRCWWNPELGPALPPEKHPESIGHVAYELFMGLVPPAALVFFALGSILFGFATPSRGGRLRSVRLPATGACLPQAELAAAEGSAAVHPRDFGADPVSGGCLQLLRGGVLAAGHAHDAHRASADPRPVADDGAADHHGTDLRARLAAGMGAHCADHRADLDPALGPAPDQPHLVRDSGGSESANRLAVAAGGAFRLFPEGRGPFLGLA